jgi:hypothetical protein
VKVPAALLKEIIASLVDEEIRKVKGGYKVYPKKPQKGRKTRRALSKKPMSREKALRQLRAVERNKALNEGDSDGGYVIPTEEVSQAIDRAMRFFGIKNSYIKNYLKEIARVESGGDPTGGNGFTHHKVNPFQLTNTSIDNSKSNVNLKKWRSIFFENRKKISGREDGIKIEDYKNSQVKENVKSGAIFALLHILWMTRSYSPDNIKELPSIEQRAQMWKRRYNSSLGAGAVDHYLRKNNENQQAQA